MTALAAEGGLFIPISWQEEKFLLGSLSHLSEMKCPSSVNCIGSNEAKNSSIWEGRDGGRRRHAFVKEWSPKCNDGSLPFSVRPVMKSSSGVHAMDALWTAKSGHRSRRMAAGSFPVQGRRRRRVKSRMGRRRRRLVNLPYSRSLDYVQGRAKLMELS